MTDLRQLGPHARIMLSYTRFGSVQNGRRPAAFSVAHQRAKYSKFSRPERVDVEPELTDWKHVVLGVCAEERRECVKLPALDVNLGFQVRLEH